MDLRALLRRTAMSRPAVLVVTLPGATRLRLEVEAELRRREWPVVGAPAAADLLVVCGDPAPEDGRAEWLEDIERSMPEPAARAVVGESGRVAGALDAGRREVVDRAVAPGGGGGQGHGHGDRHEDHAAHSGDEPHRPADPAEHMDHASHVDHANHMGHEEHVDHEEHAEHMGHAEHVDHEEHAEHMGHAEHVDHEEHAEHMGHAEHADHTNHMDHASHMDHQDHSPGGHMDHMDHAGHDMHAMADISGLPMADRADDRDKLRLDQLHVPIGPGLADWPTGLILRLALQGDVVQGVEVDHLPVPPTPRPPFWDEPWLRAAHGEEVTRGGAARRRCAAHLDSAGRLLAVVGWDDVAARFRRLRDELLAGASRTEVAGEVHRTVRRVGRSRVLRWSIAGLGRLPADTARAAGVSGPALAAAGDAHDRLLMWLGEIERGLEVLDDTRPLAPDDRSGPRGRLDGPQSPSRALLDVLPDLLTGAEFACARIVVASLDPDLDELALAPVTGAAHA
ncbi:hypothetical protein [Streptomyces sp. YU58]|uniref:hypothetical protein n=1 Tax=Streptomyces sp. SX92 TaxID=3158972 RepID=UPI0027BA2A27|nr:hypothetical protein [Streptomyces coralus]WLW50562.1 hypothetical protein QU709_03965 [Streptomyces coralus]